MLDKPTLEVVVRAHGKLGLATLAFTLCFAAWSLISPFAKSFKHDLGLDYTEALLVTAVPSPATSPS